MALIFGIVFRTWNSQFNFRPGFYYSETPCNFTVFVMEVKCKQDIAAIKPTFCHSWSYFHKILQCVTCASDKRRKHNFIHNLLLCSTLYLWIFRMLLLISVSGCNFLCIRLRMDAVWSLTQKISFQAQNYLPLQTALNR